MCARSEFLLELRFLLGPRFALVVLTILGSITRPRLRKLHLVVPVHVAAHSCCTGSLQSDIVAQVCT
jgi:hypothetical protein